MNMLEIVLAVIAVLSLGIAIGMIISHCWLLRANSRLRDTCRNELDRLIEMRDSKEPKEPVEPEEPKLDIFPKP